MQTSPSPPSEPRIHVTPERAPVDSALSIDLSGFPPQQELTLRATLDDPRGRAWCSHAVFLADPSGAVSVGSALPVSGSYAGADAEGLLWSRPPATRPRHLSMSRP